jgi:hypothetical protein
MARLARVLASRGRLFVLAHPSSVGNPTCTGCHWEFDGDWAQSGGLVEIWNHAWSGESNNEEALRLWYSWLNAGHRLVATGGSDAHSIGDWAVAPVLNAIYAPALLEPALLEAIRRGNLYLSAGPRLEFRGRAESGATAIVGDLLAADSAFLEVEWSDCPPTSTIRLVADGRLEAELPAFPSGRHAWTAGSCSRWHVVEVRDRNGAMLAVTNPIFLARTGHH